MELSNQSEGKKSESIEHMRMKLYFQDNLPSDNNITKIELERMISNRRADLYGELSDGKKFVIEFQHTKISPEELKERTLDYSRKGIYVLWILNGITYNKLPMNQDGILVSIEEEQLQKMYKGRVYYMNMAKDGLLTPVYPLHFTKYFQYKMDGNGMIRYVRYKKQRSVICGSIPSLELVFTGKKYKLARFRDVNVEWSCIKEINQYISDICKQKLSKKKKKEELISLRIPTRDIISHFKDKYGYFIPYNALRWKKGIKILKQEYMLDDKNHFREQIEIRIEDFIS